MTRTFDPAFVNMVLNDPDVRPYMGLEGTLDASLLVKDANNYVLVNEHGGFMFILNSPGVYEVHSFFLKEGRGRQALEFAQQCCEYMFIQTDCHTFLTQLPDDNQAAKSLATFVGFRPYFRRENADRGPTAYCRYTINDWVFRTEALEIEGEKFHNTLKLCKMKYGSDLPDHDYDQAHERAVGATSKMIKAGNVLKGVEFYNSWAKFAGYAPVTLLGINPTVIDIVDAVIEVRDGTMEVLECRQE
jgi:hypothetical protein